MAASISLICCISSGSGGALPAGAAGALAVAGWGAGCGLAAGLAADLAAGGVD